MSKFHALRVAHVARETRDAVALTFEVPAQLKEAFRFVQGQHLTLRAEIGGEDLRRSYSICSAVQDETLRIAVKKATGGVFSTWINDQVRPGHTLEVMPPMGHFNVPLDARQSRQYLGFAAGSGITPLLSIIKTTLAAEPRSRFTLFYGNRASAAVIFKEDLSDLKDRYLERFNLVYVMSREPQDIAVLNGRIDRAENRRAARALGRPVRHRHRVRLRSRRHDAGGLKNAAGAAACRRRRSRSSSLPRASRAASRGRRARPSPATAPAP